jgi:hypothetical protein
MKCSQSIPRAATILGLVLCIACGCREKTPAPPASQQPNPAPANQANNAPAVTPNERDEQPPVTIPAPRGQILYQPVFHWANNEETAQGTGFFVKAPHGKLAAVTSAHFIDPDGPTLLSATWQTIDGEQIAAKLTKSWGPPGKLGGSRYDQRSDYLLFLAEPLFELPQVLEFDPRPRVDDDELVWFVDKDGSQSAKEQRVIGGQVRLVSPLALMIVLDDTLALQSQSGSPFISQKTGKVIGLLSLGGEKDGELQLIAAPVSRIVKHLQDDTSFPELRTVIGKASATAP